MNQIKFIISLCLVVNCVSAQSKTTKPLKIGEAVPGLTFSMLNYKKASAKIADFKGRMVILDFWSPWCAACIAEFPKLTALQQQFKDSIVILPVGFQPFTANSILHFITMRKGTPRELKLPTAVIKQDDSTLDKLFPHQGLPFEVWIDKNGKFMAATDQYCVTAENIQKLLAGEKPYLPDIRINTNYNDQIPLLLNGNGGDEKNFFFRSVITRYLPGIKLYPFAFENTEYTRLSAGNCTILDLLIYSFAGSLDLKEGFNFGRDNGRKITIVDTTRDNLRRAFSDKDIDKQSPDSIERFNYQNLYNYDLMLPAGTRLKDAYGIMFNEICRVFKVTAAVENRKTTCLFLIEANKDSAGNFKKPVADSVDAADRDDMHYHADDINIEDFCLYLNVFMKSIPVVINKTGITQPVSLNVFFEKDDTVATLNVKLRRYGLKLVEGAENMDILVIK